jgi:hypothetical protein
MSVLVLVQVIVCMGMRVLMGMSFVPVRMLMRVYMGVLVPVDVFMLMVPFHGFSPPFAGWRALQNIVNILGL